MSPTEYRTVRIPWTGPGCPYWDGKPTPERVAKIHFLTTKDRGDRVYYRRNGADGWRRLMLPGSFADLNRVLG